MSRGATDGSVRGSPTLMQSYRTHPRNLSAGSTPLKPPYSIQLLVIRITLVAQRDLKFLIKLKQLVTQQI